MAEMATVEVSKELIEKIIQAKVETSITEALKDQGGAIERAISHVLQSPVDSNGKTTREGYYSRPFIKWLCEEAIQKAVQKAIEEYFMKNSAEFSKLVSKALDKNKTLIADSLVQSFLASAKEKDKFLISIQPLMKQ